MILVIGLGNPGEKYRKTRHNVGFIALDRVLEYFDLPSFSLNQKFNAEISEGFAFGEKIMLAKPGTYMNSSGQAVKSIMEYYKINPQNIIIVHDDIDIPLGEFRISSNRGSAGHKGIESVIEYLKTRDFKRVRIGIGTDEKEIPTEIFVLENFSENELKKIHEVVEKIITEIK